MKIRILLSKVVSAAKSGVALVVVTAIGLTAFGGATPGRGTDAYVRRGLLAIWDGIENTGSTRQHDANITAWKDVVGDRAFALTGVTITEDGLVFDGSGASSRGVLSAEDAAATFGLAGSGTMEIVLIPDGSEGQRVALQGPAMNSAGIAFGVTAANWIYMQNSQTEVGLTYNWRNTANTFSMMYAASHICLGECVNRNGMPVPNELYTTTMDMFGTPNACAFVGGRQRGDNGFSGKICCVRLYDRHLAPSDVAANAEVDRIRYREKLGKDQIAVAGDPANYGSPTPAYGTQTVEPGESVDFNVGEMDLEDGETKMHCVGHRILRMDANGGWVQDGEDSDETSFSYTHDGMVARKIEWIWQVSRPLAVGSLEIVSARRLSAEFGIYVDGVGYDGFGARLSLAWGTSAHRLDQTNVVATVRKPRDCRAHLTRTKPIDYYVCAVLEELGENGETVSVVASDVVCLPADVIEDERMRSYVTDGLVAWWDGIYNGGSNKSFESHPTLWRDVIGDVAFSVDGYTPSETGDSMVFSRTTKTQGLLSLTDTERTFGRCASGTLEIVARGNRSDIAVAVRGSEDSGIAFGPVASEQGLLYFCAYASGSNARPTAICDWNTRRSFSVRYDKSVPQDFWADGTPYVWTNSKLDYWGLGGGSGTQAIIGRRWDGNRPMDGEICAIRLYDRRLTDEEIAANVLVDDNRFRGRLTHDCLEITGASYEYGSVSPAYGHYFGLAKGAQIVCTAPDEVQEGDMAAMCTGWLIQTNAVDDASVWLPWRRGNGTECTYVNEDGVPARLVWQWEAVGGGALDLGAIGFGDIQTNSLSVRVAVLGIGDADSATLRLKWGCAPTKLDNEVSQTVSGIGDAVFTLDGLLPGRRYFVQATLSAEGAESVVSDVVACNTLVGVDTDETREQMLGKGLAYVSSVVADGWPGDGVTVKGKVEFPSEAKDCDWALLVWKEGESGTMRLEAEDVAVDGEGIFSLTVVTDDPEATNYIRPGRHYELSVVTDMGGEAVSASASCAFDAAASARFDAKSVQVTSKLREMNVKGRLQDVGAGGVATLTLMVGESIDALEEVAETVVEAANPSFSLDYVAPVVERTYWWTVRAESVSLGKTVCYTNDLPESSIDIIDSAHYEWTGAAGNGLWRDRGNWQAYRSSRDLVPIAPEDCIGYPGTKVASVVFPAGATAVIDIGGDVPLQRLDFGKPGANVTLTSAGGNTLALTESIQFFKDGGAGNPSVLTLDKVKITSAALEVVDGCQVILRNGSELTCPDYYMRFDNGVFNGGTGTNLTVVGAGCKLTVDRQVQLASGAMCVVSNGTLEVGGKAADGKLLFNCETDGGILRLEGDCPKVTVYGDCRSTSQELMKTGSGGIVFDIPEGGYQSVPIVLQTATSSFGGADDKFCVPLHLNVTNGCRAYRNAKTTVYPLLSTAGTINLARQAFGDLRRPQTSAFVYAEAADKPVWQTRDELLPTAAPKLFGVRLGAAGGLVIFFQ